MTQLCGKLILSVSKQYLIGVISSHIESLPSPCSWTAFKSKPDYSLTTPHALITSEMQPYAKSSHTDL